MSFCTFQFPPGWPSHIFCLSVLTNIHMDCTNMLKNILIVDLDDKYLLNWLQDTHKFEIMSYLTVLEYFVYDEFNSFLQYPITLFQLSRYSKITEQVVELKYLVWLMAKFLYACLPLLVLLLICSVLTHTQNQNGNHNFSFPSDLPQKRITLTNSFPFTATLIK